MRTGEATDFLSDTLGIARGTVAAAVVSLQADGLFSRGSRGRNSGADLTEMDIVNAMLALALDVARGQNVSPAVRQIRRLTHDKPPVSWPPDFAGGLTCFAKATAGTALDSIIADFRSGVFESWADGETFALQVGIDSRGGRVFLAANKPMRDPLDTRSIVAGFGRLPADDQRPMIERQITLRDEWFRQVAMRLGPRPAT